MSTRWSIVLGTLLSTVVVPAIVVVLASGLFANPLAAAGPADTRPLNIVFILVDDLGWTDLGCQGSDFYETPHIDRLAAQGMRFRQAYSACTVCSPSRAAVMTGKYPARLRVTDWIHGEVHPKARLRIPDWNHALPHEQVTVAQALAPAGYTSAAIGKWHLGDGPSHYPTTYGFDVNVAGFGAGSPSSYFSPYDMPTLADGPPGEYLTDRLADEACRFVERHRDSPFFLYWPHYAVHDPLQAKADQVERFRGKLRPGLRHDNPVYAAIIASLDDAVGKLCDKLDELGIADQTVVFFTSDNGGLINEPGVRVTSNTPLRAGKGSVYEGGVRVPLIVRWPGVAPPGSVCDEPVVSTDYYPTILEITASKGDDEHNHTLDGRSLVPLLRDPRATLDREAIYWHYPHYHGGGATPYGAVRAGDFRLVEFYEDQRVELYNLREDVGEKHDLATELPDKASELRAMLHTWRASVDAQMPTSNPDFESPPMPGRSK